MSNAPTHAIRRIVWLALLAAQAVYVVVGLLQHGSAGDSLADDRIFPVALGLVALVQLGAAHVFWRRASGAGLPLHDPRRPGPARAFTSYLVAWVLDEGAALYGLVLALLGQPFEIWLAFSAAAALVFLLHRPVDPGP